MINTDCWLTVFDANGAVIFECEHAVWGGVLGWAWEGIDVPVEQDELFTHVLRVMRDNNTNIVNGHLLPAFDRWRSA